MIDIEQLRAVLAKATPEPWEADELRTVWGRCGSVVVANSTEHEDDAAAIVAIVNAAGPLLRELEAARRLIAASQTELSGYHDGPYRPWSGEYIAALAAYDAATEGGG